MAGRVFCTCFITAKIDFYRLNRDLPVLIRFVVLTFGKSATINE
jgi:hypothetical protein